MGSEEWRGSENGREECVVGILVDWKSVLAMHC